MDYHMLLRRFIAMTLPGLCIYAQAAEIPVKTEKAGVEKALQQATEGYKLGEFRISPEVSYAQLWDDNIFATEDNREDDFVTVVTPSVSLTSAWEKHELNMKAGASFSAYARHDDEDTQDAWVDVEGRYDLTEMMNVFGGIGYSREHEDRVSVDDVNGIEPTLYRVLRSHLGLHRETGAFNLRAGATYDTLDFEDVESLTGEINNDDRDRALYSAGARIGYKYSPVYEPFLQFATDTRRYDESPDNNNQKRDSDGYRLAAGMLIKDDARLKAELLFGYIEQDYDDKALEDVNTIDFGANLSWRYSLSTMISARLDRTVEETTLRNASSYLNTSVGAGIQHKISPRSVVSATFNTSVNDYQGIDRNDDLLDLSAGIQYQLVRNLYAEGSYYYSERNSDIAGEDFRRNQLLFQLRAEILPGFGKSPLLPAVAAPVSTASLAEVAGVYLGGQVGVASLSTTLTGPRGGPDGLLQSDFGDQGHSAGVFAGYGIRLENNWYFGLELEADKGGAEWFHARSGGRIFSVEEEEKYVIAGRLGYMFNNGNLLFARAGYTQSGFDTSYRDDAGTVYDTKDTVKGYLFGGGVEVPFTNNLFWRMDYSYIDYRDNDVFFGNGTDDFDTAESRLNLGLGWRARAQRPPAYRTSARSSIPGFYVGGRFGYGQLDSAQDTVQRDSGSSRNFTADFGDHGATWGAFAGWGSLLNRIYIGLEVEAEVANNGWEHIREPTGRDYSVDKDDSYGAAVRLGYVLRNGSLLYARYGMVRTTFNTVYVKGNNAENWIDRDQSESGRRVGLGAEMPFSKDMFGRAEYTYTKYDEHAFTTTHDQADEVEFKHSEGLFSIGIGWRF